MDGIYYRMGGDGRGAQGAKEDTLVGMEAD